MWCETSGLDGSAGPAPELGIHLGMGGRIIVTAGGQASEGGGGGPRRPAHARAKPAHARTKPATPGQSRVEPFTLEFADGGSLVLFDKRLGWIRPNPDTAALGPDAERVTPAEFRQLIMKGTVAVKARLLDQSTIAGVGNLLADEALWRARVPPATRPAAAHRRRPALPRVAGRARLGHRPGWRAHRQGHRGPAARRDLPALRRRDAAWDGGRPLHLVVLARTGSVAGPGRPPAVTGSRQPCIWARAFSALRQPAVVSSRLASDASWVRSSAAVTQSLTT